MTNLTEALIVLSAGNEDERRIQITVNGIKLLDVSQLNQFHRNVLVNWLSTRSYSYHCVCAEIDESLAGEQYRVMVDMNQKDIYDLALRLDTDTLY